VPDSGFDYYKKDNKFFIKFFLLNASVNQNDWKITQDAINRNIETFRGKPFIIMPNFSHPHPEDPEDMFKEQEPYRKGTIVDVGIDDKSKKAWGIAEITDEEAQRQISNGDVRFVSPSVLASRRDVIEQNGSNILNNFEGAHVAGVKDPAFGKFDAQIKGTCYGSSHECKNKLMFVQACKECGKFDKSKTSFVADDECVQKWIKEISDSHPDWENDQVVAVAYSKCYDSSHSANTSDRKESNTTNQMAETQLESVSADVEKLRTELDTVRKEYTAKVEGLEKENASLKAQFAAEQKKPFIAKIIEAKKSLGLSADKEEERLARFEIEDLQTMQAEYETMKTKTSPQQHIKYPYSASTDQETDTKASDAFLMKLHGGRY